MNRSAPPAVGTTTASPVAARTGFLPLLVVAFVISLTIPLFINLGGVLLSPYRIVLLIGVVPLVLAWLNGAAGPKRAFDWLFIGAFLWGALALFVNHGGQALQPAVVLLVEALGAHFLARVAIRNPGDFIRAFKLQFLIIAFLIPFAIIETRTGQPPIIELMAKIGMGIEIITDPPRMGMNRVQGTFEHSILYGVFCASALAGIYYRTTFKAFFSRALATLVVMASTVMSVSSGALAAVMFQLFLFAWDGILRKVPRRWTLFALMMLAFYITIDLLSNRSPFHVLVSYMTFNSGSGWNRINIWVHGTANVAAHPIFGLGLNDWARPHWMGSSVDNYWLLQAMRFGLPMFILYAASTFLILRALSLKEIADPLVARCRAANLAVMGGLILASGTVHYWNTLFVWFVFLTSSATWVLDYKADGMPAETPEPEKGRGGRPARTVRPRGRPVRAARPGRLPRPTRGRSTDPAATPGGANKS